MYSKCQHCGEFAVDDTENIEVCKSCGIVVEGIHFSTAEPVVKRPSTFTPFSKSECRLNKEKPKPVTLMHGLNVLDNLCNVNNVSLRLKVEIIELFKLIIPVKRFSKKEDAGVAASCCLFLLMRSNKQTIPIKTLCEQVPCTKKQFSSNLKLLKSCLSSDANFKQYSYILFNNASDSSKDEEKVPDDIEPLISEVFEKAEKEEKAELKVKTSSLVKLAYSCWLATGRSPKNIVVASAFLCWKSMMIRKNRKTTFKEFCTKFEIKESQASCRVTELKALLLKLGQKIPSPTENYVNEKNLLFHLDTIIKHSEILRNDLFPDSYTCEEVDTAEFSNFREPSIKRHPRKEASDAVQYNSDMNASDIEISDSEIQSYLDPGRKDIVEFLENPEQTTITFTGNLPPEIYDGENSEH